MRVLVCGGRDFKDYDYVKTKLDIELSEYLDENGMNNGSLCIIHGGATGADRLADKWAVNRWVKVDEYKADWVKHGKAAGVLRNQQMLTDGRPDLVIAFPGGKGTEDMTIRATREGVKVIKCTQ